MTHTPGKWEVLGPNPSITVGVEFAPDMFDIVATVWDWKDGEACEVIKANARLIAAAPDMLATLKALMDDRHNWEAWLDAENVIAKAEGDNNG